MFNSGTLREIRLGEVRSGSNTLLGTRFAFQEHVKLNPHWLQDSGLPVCAWQGVGVSRKGVSEALRLAAVALGYPAHLVASHSLRKGGATAMLAVTSDVETVKRFGGWKSDAEHAYLYTDMAAAPDEMLTSKPVLQPQQHAPAPNRVGYQSFECESSVGTRCGGPEDPRPEDEEFGDSDDPDWRSARAKFQDQERRTGLTFIQRLRLKKQIAKGGIVEPPVFLQRFGGIPEWIESASTSRSSHDAESAPMYTTATAEPPFQATADDLFFPPQHFLPEQVFHSPSRRPALPPVVMADNAPRPAATYPVVIDRYLGSRPAQPVFIDRYWGGPPGPTRFYRSILARPPGQPRPCRSILGVQPGPPRPYRSILGAPPGPPHLCKSIWGDFSTARVVARVFTRVEPPG